MKKEFAELIKDMRITIRPQFKSMFNFDLKPGETLQVPDKVISDMIDELEAKQDKMILEAGWTNTEFHAVSKEYFIDFSSENPDEWIIRHDPENAKVITPTNQ